MMGRPVEEGVLSGSCGLYYDPELVCCAERVVASTSETERDQKEEGAFFTLEYIHGDGVTGTFPPKNVRHRITFRAGEKTWEFEFRHQRPWYEMLLGPPRPNVTGLMGYIVTVSGGLVGSEESEKGPGMVGGGIMP